MTSDHTSGEIIQGSVTLTDACITSFSFKTNGYQGGDAGHGGYLEMEIVDEASTCMEAIVEEGKIAVRFRGDAEMRIVAEGLEFLARRIRQALVGGRRP